jgi:hypothetical protein
MTEYNKLAHGTFTSTGATKIINLPFIPGRIELWNYSAANAAPAANAVVSAYWDVGMGQGFAFETVYNSTPVLVADTVTVNGFSTFQAGLSQQFGANQQIIGITKASAGRVNVTAHGYSVGDTVVLQGLSQSATTGMQQIAGIPFTIVTVSDANHFDINWNTNQSNFTALSGSPTGAFVKKVLYPFLYEPGDNVVSAITTGTTTTIVTTMYHNFEVGQEIAFRIPSVYGTTQLNSLPNVLIPGSPMYGYVTSITDNWTFVCNINSSAYTAFNSNQPFVNYSGLQFPQVVAVGDVNTGGQSITATSPLYPSPQFPTSSNRVPTINGPAIKGAFVNNTSQGFIIGTGAGTNQTSSVLVGANGNIMYWAAYANDIRLTS